MTPSAPLCTSYIGLVIWLYSGLTVLRTVEMLLLLPNKLLLSAFYPLCLSADLSLQFFPSVHGCIPLSFHLCLSCIFSLSLPLLCPLPIACLLPFWSAPSLVPVPAPLRHQSLVSFTVTAAPLPLSLLLHLSTLLTR